MELSDFARQQQDLIDKVMPPNMRWLIELHNKIKPVIDFPKIELFKPIIDLPNFTFYKNTFEILEVTKKMLPSNQLLETFEVIKNFSFKDYDFASFINEAEGKETVSILFSETSRTKKIIGDIYHDNSELLKIKPREFEEVIAELLYYQGFEIELTKQTRDNGYDILAIKYLDKHIPLKFLVECKRYKNKKVGVEIIRSFKEVIATEQANRGIIVTTSYFSSDAKKKQEKTPYLLDYKDKDNVIDWVNDYWTNKKPI